MDIYQLIAEHGSWAYPIAFVWTFLEGETIVLFAGFAAAQGLLDPRLLLLATGLGSFAGDQTCFWIGRRFGPRLLRRFPRWQNGVETALQWLEQYDAGFILSFRFIYGVRNFSSLAMGLSAIRWQRFLALNFLAAMLWAACFVALGYFFGSAFRAILGDVVRSFSLGMLVIFVVFAVGVGLVQRAQKRRSPSEPRAVKTAIPPS